MKKFSSLLLIVFVHHFVQAHPGIGIVYDGNRLIYYTDLQHVWKLDTKSGVSEIFVENVHTHELVIDGQGNLYGEHYWYVESEQKFKNYIWRADKLGSVQKIRKDEYGENLDFSFIRDRNFSSYEVLKNSGSYEVVLKDSVQEKVLAKLELNNPTWKYLSKENELFIVDYPSIYKLSKGNVSKVASDFSSNRFPFSFVNDAHNIYGIWTDSENKLYVAQYGGREIRSINAQGEINRVAKSGFLWSPVNGLFDKNDNMWVMECKIGGKIRLRKIAKEELSARPSFFLENMVTGTFLLLLSVSSIIWIRNTKRKKKTPKILRQA